MSLGRDDAWLALVEASLKYGLERADTDSLVRAASMVAGALRELGAQAFADWMRDDVGNVQVVHRELAEALAGLHSAILTTNYDTLLETTLGRGSATWLEPMRLQELVLGKSDLIGHLHGAWDRPESVVFSEADYSRLLQSPAAQSIQQAVSVVKTLVYVGFGAGLDDPNFGKLLAWHRETFAVSGAEHFRLCRTGELPELQRMHVADAITPIAYGPSFSDLPTYLRSLAPSPGAVTLSASGIVKDAASEAQQALADTLVQDSVIAETIRVDGAAVEHVLMVPVLLPVPNAQFVRSRRRQDKSARLERIDPRQDAREAELIVVVGDDETGVTTTIKWMALEAAQHLGNVAPLYVNFRDCKRAPSPLRERVGSVARELGLAVGADGSLPAHVLAIDDLNANVPRLSDMVLENISSSDAFSVVIGCKTGFEEEVVDRLKMLGLKPRVRYLGRLSDSDVKEMARAVAPSNHEPLAKHVVKLLRAENLPRTPLSVSLLLSILFQGGRIASSASQTLILDQYVSSLLGRGDPHEDARYEIDQPGREALLAGLAEFYVERGAAGLPESDVIRALESVLGRMGWSESPSQILRGLVKRRVLRRYTGVVVFSRNSYLYLFAAKRAGMSPAFLSVLLERPLYYASILKNHAALVRHDDVVLRRVRPLALDRFALRHLNSPFEIVGPIEPPTLEAIPGPVVDHEDEGEPRRELTLWPDDGSMDDDTAPPFPADDPMEMSFAMRLLRALDLVSTILRDSDQIEDLPLKRDVLAEALEGWGVAVEALAEDPQFQEFTRELIEEVSPILVEKGVDERERSEILEEFSRIFPAAMSLGGIEATLSSRKLIAAYDRLYVDGVLERSDETALGAVSFAYSLREPGWPGKIHHLVRDRGNQWIGSRFFLYLFYEDYVHDKCDVNDRDSLLELCVHLTVAPMRFDSEAEKKRYADTVRADYRNRRLRWLARARVAG